jgi:hypothetical protein
MKIIRVVVFMLSIISFYPLRAQYNTGDADLDKTLLSLDLEASISDGAFKTNVSRIYNLSSSNIQYLIVEIGMTAGDIYLTLEIAKITKKSVNQVVEAYQNNREKGWGTIAKELGIVPGSDEFNQLKDKLTNHA